MLAGPQVAFAERGYGGIPGRKVEVNGVDANILGMICHCGPLDAVQGRDWSYPARIPLKIDSCIECQLQKFFEYTLALCVGFTRSNRPTSADPGN